MWLSLLLKGGLGELRKDESSLVDLRVVVTAKLGFLLGSPLAQRLLQGQLLVLGKHHETNLTTGVSGDGSVGVLDNGEEGAAESLNFLDERKMEPHAFTLSRDDSVVSKSVLHELKETLLEQGLGRSNRVRRVSDDHIKGVDLVLQVRETVTNVDVDVGVLEANSHVGQVLLGNTGNSLVNFAKDNFLNAIVLDNFTEHTTITTTNNKDLLGVWVRVHSQVGDHFLVREFITLSALNDTIENQDVTIVGGLENKDILVQGLFDVKDFLDLDSHSLTGPKGGLFMEPTVLDGFVGELSGH